MLGIAPIVVIVGNYLYFLLYYTIIKINISGKYSNEKYDLTCWQNRGEQANGTA